MSGMPATSVTRKSYTLPGAGAASSDGEEELDAQTAADLLDLGIVSPVTRESAGSLYHKELARQVGVLKQCNTAPFLKQCAAERFCC